MKKKVLIIDNNIDQPWPLGKPFMRYLHEGELHARRAPQADFPFETDSFTHLILSGSKTSCEDQSEWILKLEELIRKFSEKQKPILGICFGHQMIARTFCGIKSVGKARYAEYGWVEMTQESQHPLLNGVNTKFHSFQSHGEEVYALSKDFSVTAKSEQCKNQAFYHNSLPVFGVQFHPERDALEGERSLDHKILDVKKGLLSKDCIFNRGRAKSLYSEEIARCVFANFLKII